MDPGIELLGRLPLFADLSPRELAAVAVAADEVDVPSGRTLTAEGAGAHEFVVLVEGAARVERHGLTIATLRGGDFLGEIALLMRSRRTATVTTTAPSRLLVIGDRAFRGLLATVPALNARVWAAAAARL